MFVTHDIGAAVEIADRVEKAMSRVSVIQEPSMTQILEADAAAREAVLAG